MSLSLTLLSPVSMPFPPPFLAGLTLSPGPADRRFRACILRPEERTRDWAEGERTEVLPDL